MSFYLDASVVVPLFIQQTSSDAIEEWVLGNDLPMLVSDLTASEFSSAISRFVRKGELPEDLAPARHRAFEEWRRELAEPVENHSADIRHAAVLVRTPLPRLLTPDAIHLATCTRLGATLVTNDNALIAIAKREGVRAIGIPVPG